MRRSKSNTSFLPTIEVRHSRVHGHGAFAARDLPIGCVVGTYAGQRYTAQDVSTTNWDGQLTYLFGLSDGSVIDGGDGGNETRHLNHACEPNCEAIEYYDEDERLMVRIEATQHIAAGDELFLDYALEVDATDDPSDYPCRCGVTRCRGTLIATVES